MASGLRLELVTLQNVRIACDLKVRPDQEGLVAPVAISLAEAYATTTGIFPIFACHSFGPVWCTEVPLESTATVTGMSLTSNS